MKNIAVKLIALLFTLAGLTLPSRGEYIDNFAVGPQSFQIGAGDASAGGPATNLDPSQVAWGSRSFTIYADQQGCGFRPLDLGSIAVTVNGSAPGSCSVQVAESVTEGENDYEPWIYLSYPGNGTAVDWSAFDRIVISFSSPPTADLSVQTWVTSETDSGSSTWYAPSTAAAGGNLLTILFSDLTASGAAFTGSNVASCAFSFSPPMVDYFVIGAIQVITPPSLNAVMSGGDLTLTWPTNAAGFVLQHTTNMSQSFAAVTANPLVVGTNYSLTLPCGCASEFFRLQSGP
jgi:hypothetical protein